MQHKKSKNPGDSKAMIAARTRFLDAGFYTPIATALNTLVEKLIAADKQVCLLDAGCGEGYYLEHMLLALKADAYAGEMSIIGLDISKWAIQAAAKRASDITWVVGSNRQLPVSPQSLDGILCLFGFPQYEVFKKALHAGSWIVLADPGPDHLIELRELIYPSVKKTPPPDLTAAHAQGYRLEHESTLNYRIDAANTKTISDLLGMTPHLFRAPAQGKHAAAAVQQLSLTVDVVFRILRLD